MSKHEGRGNICDTALAKSPAHAFTPVSTNNTKAHEIVLFIEIQTQLHKRSMQHKSMGKHGSIAFYNKKANKS